MHVQKYDVIVIGSGPAGEAAAINMAKNNKKVAVIEDRDCVGGSCIHVGTIPSKTLRHFVKQAAQFNNSPITKNYSNKQELLNFTDLLKHTKTVINQQVRMRESFYSRNRVDIFYGSAKFKDSRNITVKTGTEIQHLLANDIIIATGSAPYLPANIKFNHLRVFNSDTIFNLTYTPRTLIIYGAGVIGCEYASIFSHLGTKIDLINTKDKLLSFLDEEISDALSYHLRESGNLIHHNEKIDDLKTTDLGVELKLKSGKIIRAEAFLWANGRIGNTAKLDLDKIGIQPDNRGNLIVDQYYATAIKGVYAVGDVVGWPSLTSASYAQGRSASSFILGDAGHYITDVPAGIYTIPEISAIGKTEEELSKDKVPYEIGRAFFKEMARAQITNELVGMLKILFHRESLEILGIHCFGYQASEIIHIGQAVMFGKGGMNNLHYFIDTTFNYPTMAEVYRVAAIRGLNRIGRKDSNIKPI